MLQIYNKLQRKLENKLENKSENRSTFSPLTQLQKEPLLLLAFVFLLVMDHLNHWSSCAEMITNQDLLFWSVVFYKHERWNRDEQIVYFV